MRRCPQTIRDADDQSGRHLGGWAHAPSAPLGRHSEASQGFTFFSSRMMFRCGASSENPTVFPMQELEREIPDELAALSRLASIHGRWRANERPAAQQGTDPKEAIERFRLAEATQQPPDVEHLFVARSDPLKAFLTAEMEEDWIPQRSSWRLAGDEAALSNRQRLCCCHLPSCPDGSFRSLHSADRFASRGLT